MRFVILPIFVSLLLLPSSVFACQVHEECGFGQMCEDGACVYESESASNKNRATKKHVTCKTHKDCPEGALCLNGKCTDSNIVEKKIDQGKQTGNMLFGLTASMLLNPEVKINSGSGVDCEFGGGFNLLLDYYVWDYIALGADIYFSTWKVDAPGEKNNYQFSIDPSIRGLYAFGNNNTFEIFGRFAIGYTAFILNSDYSDFVDADTEHGWNIKVGPGFKYKMENGFALLAELGWYRASFKFSESDTYGYTNEWTVIQSSMYLDFGIGYQF